MEVFTCILSLVAVGLYVAKALIVAVLTKDFNDTGGNGYIRMTFAASVNQVWGWNKSHKTGGEKVFFGTFYFRAYKQC